MDNDFREVIGREQLRLVMQQVPTMQAASVVVALALSYVVRDIVPRGKILLFVLSITAVAVSRVILYRRFLGARTKPFAARNWEKAYLLLALLSGIVWGSSAFLILPHGDAWLLALFVLVMASLSASTTVSHSSIKWAPAAFIVPALLIYAIRCILAGGEQEPILAFLIVLYMTVMLQYSLKHHRTIESSIALRFENLKLLEESRQSEERLFEAQKIAQLGYYRLDVPTGSWTSSKILDDVFGIVDDYRKDLEGWSLLVHPEERKSMMEYFLTDVLGKMEPFNREYRIVRRSDQCVRWVHGLGKVEYDSGGKPVAMIGTIQDITERKRTDVALRESEDRLRVILDSTDDGILAVDASGKTIFSNRRFSKLWRIPQALMNTCDDNAMLDYVLEQLADPDGFLREVKRLYGTAEISNDTILFKDSRLLERYTMPMMEDGSVVGRLWSFRDVTDRKQAEEEKEKLRAQLQQAMKMEAVGRLAGGVAHDFNNLLTAIMGNVSLAIMKLSPSDPAGGLLAEANKAAESAASLTQQLLAFSRKQIIKPKVLDLNILIADMNKMLVRLIGENIDLKTVPGEGLGLVKVDAGQFEQILVNLAVNARDAMPEGGKILIETVNVDLDKEYCVVHPYVLPGRFVMLAVSDMGQGMSEEVKRQIFEPFFTTKPKGTGTGLGLATIYGVVKQANGYIEVYSEVGKGTTFKIYLPRVDGETTRLPESFPPMELLEGSETVLLVEDEEIVRNLGVRILAELGYRVIRAGNGDEAIALAREHGERIDLLLTDVVMPGMSGRELANRLTRIHPETRVLFTSGYTDNAIVHHGVLDEGVSFIGKPYTPSALAGKVREVLDKA
jgi:PAS domain S-box-containing protein